MLERLPKQIAHLLLLMIWYQNNGNDNRCVLVKMNAIFSGSTFCRIILAHLCINYIINMAQKRYVAHVILSYISHNLIIKN
ncbi:hypothetical protein LPB03_12115 [Polaribacter vadi]|uniref:Uncharacterized protein n=1 Tax=Polaribacter vadi TaxID=1774273 RepID=A0A1B8TT68_9FLAO|nr:hypothetical protein LPB03_12115 [Polaribacter vadi]OBY62881.1 hypothetical protein LPB3_12130 [Polaribacter vadi]